MGELYNPYPKLPKNIRQIGERDQVMKLYVEDYVNTYLKRLYPAGGQDLRAGLLLGEIRTEDGMPYVFVDGAMEMEGVTETGEKVVFTEDAWKKAYQTMEKRFPKRSVLGWFLCGAPGSFLSPLNYWKEHSQYFAARYQLMYLNSGLEGEEAVYTATEDSFYKLRGYCIYYERNQMMQDYMVSRREARRVESGARDEIIRDFRQKLEDRHQEAHRRHTTAGVLGTACSVLAVAVLASGVVLFNNYHKMKAMESVIASVVPEGTGGPWSDYLTKGSYADGEVDFEEIPGEVYPTRAEIVIEPESQMAAGSAGIGQAEAGTAQMAAAGANQAAAGAAGAGTDAGQAPESGAAGTSAGVAASSVTGTGAGQATAGAAGSSTGAGQAVGEAAASAGQQSGHSEPAAEPVQVPADAVAYTVQEGETLYGICINRYHGLSHLDEICRWNGLDDENRIFVGQTLYVPPVPQ